MTTICRLTIAIVLLAAGSAALKADEPKPCLSPLCQQLKSRCVCAPYCAKTAPCAPCYAVSVTCAEYCKKAAPDCECYYFEWCTSIYCKKCIPCFPGDPCERQVWHSPCPPPCAVYDPALIETAMLGKSVAF